MSRATSPTLRLGKAYRTKDFATKTSNPTRLVGQLVCEGKLRKLRGGLYFRPSRSRWGELPPDPVDLLNTWLEGRQGRDWIFTGSEVWNALGLGSTAVHAVRRVYNRRRSGFFEIGGHRFKMHKVPFPKNPSPEWFVVDLLNHTRDAAVDTEDVLCRLANALSCGRFDREKLLAMAQRFGRKSTHRGVEKVLNRYMA